MSRMKEIPEEKKVEIVRAYNRKEIGLMEASRQGGVNFDTIVSWVRNYESEGVGAFLPHRNRIYTAEEKIQAVKEYLNGEGSIRDICKKYKIRSTSRLRAWLKEYNGGGYLGSVKHSGGGSYMKQGRETTQTERIEIAKACLANGKNYGETALKYQVSYQQARTWTRRF